MPSRDDAPVDAPKRAKASVPARPSVEGRKWSPVSTRQKTLYLLSRKHATTVVDRAS
jgi:hypothetical protein